VHFISNAVLSQRGGVDPSNNGNASDFVSAAAQGQVGVYQLLGVIDDGQPVPANR
jgi:hypothetical protein